MSLRDKVNRPWIRVRSNFDPTSYVASFLTSRLRFIKFSKPDAIVTPFQEDSRQLTRGEFPTKGSTRTSRSIAPSGISSAPSRGGCARRPAFVPVVPFPVVFGFHWNSARVFYVALIDRRFFDHENISRGISGRGWRSLCPRAGCQNATSALSFGPYKTDSFSPHQHAPAELSELSFSIARRSNVIVVERALVIPQIRASTANLFRDRVTVERDPFCLPDFPVELLYYRVWYVDEVYI